MTLEQKLIQLAGLTAWTDNPNFNIMDWCGSNYDDTYFGGYSDGEIGLARELLKEYFATSG